VPHNFGLLLKSVPIERFVWNKFIGVSAKRVAHQREVEAAALLALPDVSHFVDEHSLRGQGLVREIVRPLTALGMEMDIAGRRHHHAFRLEWPPAPPDEPDASIIDCLAKHAPRKVNFVGC
jgi:hypothetical protein